MAMSGIAYKELTSDVGGNLLYTIYDLKVAKAEQQLIINPF